MINGFEFCVDGRWLRLMGSGGCLGDGLLCVLNGMEDRRRRDFLARVLPTLLKQAQRAAENGDLREYRDVEDYRKRITPISGIVTDIRVREGRP